MGEPETDIFYLWKRIWDNGETSDESEYENRHLSNREMSPNRLSVKTSWLCPESPFWNVDKGRICSDETNLWLVSTRLTSSSLGRFDWRSPVLGDMSWLLLWHVFVIMLQLPPWGSASSQSPEAFECTTVVDFEITVEGHVVEFDTHFGQQRESKCPRWCFPRPFGRKKFFLLFVNLILGSDVLQNCMFLNEGRPGNRSGHP